jgi:hypothetical protein
MTLAACGAVRCAGASGPPSILADRWTDGSEARCNGQGKPSTQRIWVRDAYDIAHMQRERGTYPFRIWRHRASAASSCSALATRLVGPSLYRANPRTPLTQTEQFTAAGPGGLPLCTSPPNIPGQCCRVQLPTSLTRAYEILCARPGTVSVTTSAD